jgi:autotransporter-associated beta strand protein
VDLSGATLTLSNTVAGAAPALPNLVMLIQNNSAGAITINDSTTPAQGATVTIGTALFKIFYSGGDGNDVVLANGAAPSPVYVSATFAGDNPGQSIADADFGTNGNQPAVFGVNAFTTIAAAQAATNSCGTIVVNRGTYAEAVSLTGTQTLCITGPGVAGAVTINSLTGVAGTTVQIDGSSTLTDGDATSTTFAGTITGGGSLTKQGTGTLTLTATDTYTGTTTINFGTLDLQGSLSGAGGNVILAGNNTTLSSGNSLGTIPSRMVVVSLGATGATISNLAQITNSGGTAVSVVGMASLSANTIANSSTGVDITGSATLTNNAISGDTTGVLDHAGGTVTFSGTNHVTGGSVGLQVDGLTSRAGGLTVGTTAFAGQGSYYIELTNNALQGPQMLDASAATFEGVTGANMTNAQYTAAEAMLFHFPNDPTVGLIVLKTGTAFMQNNNLMVIGSGRSSVINVNDSNPANVYVTSTFGSFPSATQGKFDVRQGRVLVFTLGGKDTVNMIGSVSTEIHCGSGNDTVYGGFGKDVIFGGPGNDTLIGRGTADVLVGGGGQDVLMATGGEDILIAGALAGTYDSYTYLDGLRTALLASNPTFQAMLQDLVANGINHQADATSQCTLSHMGGGTSAFVHKSSGAYLDKVYGEKPGDHDQGY